MDDLISREETLKAMDTWDKFGYDAYGRLFPLRSQDELHLYVPYVHYADMVNVVKGMPSAEPEIIRCKDCKHSDNRISDGRYWCKELYAYMYYCSEAERRTDG